MKLSQPFLFLVFVASLVAAQVATPAGTAQTATYASGVTVELTVPETVSEGGDVAFGYAIKAQRAGSVEFYARIDCPAGGPVDFMNIQEVEVSPETPYQGYQKLGVLNYGWWETGTCVATVQVLKPVEQAFTKTFEVVVAPNLKVETDSYGSKGATGNKRVFVLGETVWIKSAARANTGEGVSNVVFTVKVELNNKVVKTLKGSTVSFKPTVVGYYTYRVTASASGFKDGEAVVRTTFVARHYTPSAVQMPACNQNGVCDAGESVSTCPWDCPLSAPVTEDDAFTRLLTPEPKTTVVASVTPVTPIATSAIIPVASTVPVASIEAGAAIAIASVAPVTKVGTGVSRAGAGISAGAPPRPLTWTDSIVLILVGVGAYLGYAGLFKASKRNA